MIEKGPTAPSLAGTYALALRSAAAQEILVGKLGTLAMQPGFYVYVGSALGPGGLASRVGRHARAAKKCRWHIDYLVAIATLDEVWYTVDPGRRECQWADALRQIRGGTVPLDRLTHRCHILEATGESYRLQDARRRRGVGRKSKRSRAQKGENLLETSEEEPLAAAARDLGRVSRAASPTRQPAFGGLHYTYHSGR